MWQAPNQRAGAVQTARRKQQERNSRPFRLRRVRAEVRIIPAEPTMVRAESESRVGELREARVILNDLSPRGIGIHASHSMQPGDRIRITLPEPRKVIVEGRVVWCTDQHAGSPIISHESFNYRVGVKFIFDCPEAEEAFRKFCEELQSTYLYSADPAAGP